MTEHSTEESSSQFDFNEAERAFFGAQVDQINRLIAMMNNAANLVVMQNDLPGQWQLRPDGTGLIKL
jgi:hypothetical protein